MFVDGNDMSFFNKIFSCLMLGIGCCYLTSCASDVVVSASGGNVRGQGAIQEVSLESKLKFKTIKSKSGESKNNSMTESDILILGDSHAVGAFGLKLISDLVNIYPKSNVTLYAVCGSSPSWWQTSKVTYCGYLEANSMGLKEKRKTEKTPNVKDLIEKHKPKLIVIQMGTNLIQFKDEPVREEIRQFLTVIKNSSKQSEIMWIGPPDARKYSAHKIEKTFNIIKSECLMSHVMTFDSYAVTRYPRSSVDGVHYSGPDGEEESKKWAAKVANTIRLNY